TVERQLAPLGILKIGETVRAGRHHRDDEYALQSQVPQGKFFPANIAAERNCPLRPAGHTGNILSSPVLNFHRGIARARRLNIPLAPGKSKANFRYEA